jgi:hypothetical protein
MPATATAPAPAATAGLARPAGPWKKLSKAMTAEIPAIAGRPVPVACAPGAGLGNAACYIPEVPVIEVNGKHLGVAPATCDPASPDDRERYPVTWGALIHECAHVAHTSDALPPPDRANWRRAASELEESRIEARQAGRRPGDRRWLRAATTKIILDDFTSGGAQAGTPREAGLAAALLLAREDAGILEPGETAAVAAQVESIIGPDALARLRATWREVHQTADGDVKSMTRLARRWCRILRIDPDAAPPVPAEVSLSDLLDAIREAINEIEAAVEADFTPPPPFPTGAAEERADEKRSRIDAEKAARDAFGRKVPPPAVTRAPSGDEAAAARRLARALRESTAGGRDKVTTISKVPPGRLRMGKALASRAQRAAGAVPTAEPFTRTRSRRVPAPPLRVGIACDISGSMTDYTAPVASAAWILARAAGHIPSAATATLLYGERVHGLTWPGETPPASPTSTPPTATRNSAGPSTPSTARSASPAPAPPASWSSSPTPTTPPTRSPAASGASPACTGPAAASSSSAPRTASTPATSGPTARSSTSRTPPTPSTPSPAPPPAPSPPNPRPGAKGTEPAALAPGGVAEPATPGAMSALPSGAARKTRHKEKGEIAPKHRVPGAERKSSARPPPGNRPAKSRARCNAR